MTIRNNARVAALLAATTALIAGALALWLSAAPPSGAASAEQVQGTTVSVIDRTISWGSAGDCVQSMDTADFGSVLPGTNLSSVGHRGCVTSSSSGWAVTAEAADLTDGANTIAKDSLAVFTSILTGSAPSGSAPCEALCPLGTPQTVLSGAEAGVGGFEYGLHLAVPGTTPAGAYTGAVTFTASN